MTSSRPPARCLARRACAAVSRASLQFSTACPAVTMRNAASLHIGDCSGIEVVVARKLVPGAEERTGLGEPGIGEKPEFPGFDGESGVAEKGEGGHGHHCSAADGVEHPPRYVGRSAPRA